MDIWEKIQKAFKTAYNWLLRYPVALVVSIAVVLGAALLLLFGVGDRFNVGGFIGKMFGKDGGDEDDNVKVANKVPENRVDEEGKPIPQGEPDKEGWVQQEVEVLDQSKNPFRDKSKLKINEDGKSKSVKLPTGVKDTDVKKVIRVSPKEYEVVVKEGPSKVDQETIDILRGDA